MIETPLAVMPAPLTNIWCALGGSIVRIRPIESTDARLIREFVQSLSLESRYLRFMSGVRELSAKMIDRLTRVDHRRDAALIAVASIDGANRTLGVARYALNADDESCDFAIVVADDWHRRGLGSHLLSRLVAIASERGLKRMCGDVLAINRPMADFARAHGFSVRRSDDEPTLLRVERQLDSEPT